MTITQLYLLFAAATAMAGLVCIGGVMLAERLSRRASRRVLALFAVAFVALLPIPFDSIWPISLVVLLGVGVFGGSAIGRVLVTSNSIVVFLIVVSVVDVASFSGGPTAWIVDSYRTGANELLLHLALTFPVHGDRARPVALLQDHRDPARGWPMIRKNDRDPRVKRR